MKKFSIYILYVLVAVFAAGLSSCSETDNETEEYPDWKNANDQYFSKKYTEVKSLVDGGSTEWKILRSWSLTETTATHSYDHVLVNVMENGTGSGCPLYTDSVEVHYQGRLIPSVSYPDGYVFDKSWKGDFNEATAVPSKFAVKGVVVGFSTALQYMHIGDKWRVYIPYQLGYGSLSTPGAAYSTLIFDVELVAYYRANSATTRQASESGNWGEPKGQWIYQ